MTAKTPIDIIYHYVAAYNTFDIDTLCELVDDDIIFENWSGDECTVSTEGIEEFRALANKGKEWFTTRHQTVETIEHQEKCWTAWITFNAVVACDLPNGITKGATLEMKGRSEFYVKDGKIVCLKDFSE